MSSPHPSILPNSDGQYFIAFTERERTLLIAALTQPSTWDERFLRSELRAILAKLGLIVKTLQ